MSSVVAPLLRPFFLLSRAQPSTLHAQPADAPDEDAVRDELAAFNEPSASESVLRLDGTTNSYFELLFDPFRSLTQATVEVWGKG